MQSYLYCDDVHVASHTGSLDPTAAAYWEDYDKSKRIAKRHAKNLAKSADKKAVTKKIKF